MDFLLAILFVILLILIIVFIIISFFVKDKNNKNKKENKIKGEKKEKPKSKEEIYLAIDEYKKILKNSPDKHNVRESLADALVEVQAYVNAIKEYMILLNKAGIDKNINETEILLKIANAFELSGDKEEAKKYYLLIKKKDNLNLKANIFLAKYELEKKEYEKALALFNIVMKLDPENQEVEKFLGITYFYCNRFKNAIELFIKYLKNNPNDSDVIYYLGYSFYSLNRTDDAIRYFSKIKNNEQYAAEINYFIGNIHKKQKIFFKAIEEFQNAITSNKLDEEKLYEAYYQLAESYLFIHDTTNAIATWKKLYELNPQYKDIAEKIETYSQLESHSLLEKYLLGSVNQLTNLCKLFIKYYLTKHCNRNGLIKFTKIQMLQDNSLEIYLEFTVRNVVEFYYFLFLRSVTTVGDFTLRSLYNKLKEEKIDKAVCVTAGNFSQTAKEFVESRMIELVEKDLTIEILENVKSMLN
ncbi:MAG TPA: tetratricopeptide repeat protein [Spirochaetota bacterium]|nr:tetratricopeptide repeat protein [Spirochaetota bacterium]HOL56512.1 tetratricopeptide repeat protein [Spirochaetota bacterium]HPP03936.1 tetratricopeptide repeat protein [Spirochaetota bacterium]